MSLVDIEVFIQTEHELLISSQIFTGTIVLCTHSYT